MMIKYPIHKVAKDFKKNGKELPSKEIMEILTQYGHPPKNHMQPLTDEELSIVFEYLTQHNQIDSIESVYADVYHEPQPPKKEEPKAAEKPAYTATEVGAIPLSMADSFARKNEVAGAYIYRGSVAGFDALPASGAAVGDVYNVEDTGMNYGWTGAAWDALGQMFQLDPLSEEEIKAILGVTA